jgi:transcriptional regulator with XRE-family HTH domain
MGRAEFADRLDRLLDDKDLDQLAREVGLKDKSAFSHYRSGKRAPDLDRFAAICRALNVTADEFLGLKPPTRTARAPRVPVAPDEYIRFRLHCPHCKAVIEETKVDGKADGQRRRRK